MSELSILDALKEANDVAGIKWLAFADLQKFNSFHDSANGLDYPVNLVVPYTLQPTLQRPISKKTLQLQGWVLTRISQDTNDWRHPELQKDVIDPMTRLAESFLLALTETTIADNSGQPPVASIFAEYMWLSSHLFGVSYRCNLQIKGRAC